MLLAEVVGQLGVRHQVEPHELHDDPPALQAGKDCAGIGFGKKRCTDAVTIPAGARRMSQRIAIGGFLHESHSFAPRPTTYADFVHPAGFPPLSEGAAVLDAVRGTSVPAAGALAAAEAAGATVIPLAWSFANPAGPVQDEAFERIAALICAAAVACTGRCAAGWGVSRSAWRGGGGKLPRRRGRIVAPGPRHRGRPADHDQPRSARQSDGADGDAR